MMKKLLILTFSLCAPSFALAQSKDSTVRYRDPATEKETSVTGTISRESPAGIVLKPRTGPERPISAARVLDVEYPAPSATISLELRSAHNAASAGQLDKALAQLQAVLPRLADSPLKRHTEYTIARLTAQLAQREHSQVKPALERLLAYKKKYPESWEIGSLLDLLVPLQVAEKDLAGAQKTLAELAAVSTLGPETRLECNILSAKLLVEEKKYPEAEKKLNELLRTAQSRDATRIRIALAECKIAANPSADVEKELETLAAQVTDPELKAYAYNALGDCYQRKGEPKKAMWNYLHVDVLYPQNKQEQARALYNLYKVFTALKDDRKAQLCRELLERDKQFAGKYQEMMLREK